MELIALFAGAEIGVLVGGLALLVFYLFLSGRINTKGLLLGRNGEFSPMRLQLLVIVVAAAGYYLLQAVAEPRQMPQVPEQLVLVLSGSNLVYIGGKAYSLLLR